MQRFIYAGVVSLLLAATITLAAAPWVRAGNEDKKMLRHMVLYNFKDDLKPEQVQEVVDAFAALPGKIDTIESFEYGTNVSPEGKSEGLTHGEKPRNEPRIILLKLRLTYTPAANPFTDETGSRWSPCAHSPFDPV
jgi:Stress responsive A/B Barrel Domain